MASATDIIGYAYKADSYTPEALIQLMIQEGTAAPGAAQMDVEEALTQIAEANGLDRFDEASFDSGEFPKVIFASQGNPESLTGYTGARKTAGAFQWRDEGGGAYGSTEGDRFSGNIIDHGEQISSGTKRYQWYIFSEIQGAVANGWAESVKDAKSQVERTFTERFSSRRKQATRKTAGFDWYQSENAEGTWMEYWSSTEDYEYQIKITADERQWSIEWEVISTEEERVVHSGLAGSIDEAKRVSEQAAQKIMLTGARKTAASTFNWKSEGGGAYGETGGEFSASVIDHEGETLDGNKRYQWYIFSEIRGTVTEGWATTLGAAKTQADRAFKERFASRRKTAAVFWNDDQYGSTGASEYGNWAVSVDWDGGDYKWELTYTGDSPLPSYIDLDDVGKGWENTPAEAKDSAEEAVWALERKVGSRRSSRRKRAGRPFEYPTFTKGETDTDGNTSYSLSGGGTGLERAKEDYLEWHLPGGKWSGLSEDQFWAMIDPRHKADVLSWYDSLGDASWVTGARKSASSGIRWVEDSDFQGEIYGEAPGVNITVWESSNDGGFKWAIYKRAGGLIASGDQVYGNQASAMSAAEDYFTSRLASRRKQADTGLPAPGDEPDPEPLDRLNEDVDLDEVVSRLAFKPTL